MPHLVQQETTLAYLENQIAAALILQSSHEYHHWLLIYARYLVNEGETCQALVLLCSSEKHSVHVMYVCDCPQNPPFSTWLLGSGLLRTKTNCICCCSAESSGVLFGPSDWGQTVWGSRAICRLQEWQLHCETAQWSGRHILGIIWQQIQMFQGKQEHLVKCITLLSQLAIAAWCEVEGLLSLWHFVPKHIKLQRNCLYCLHFILFLHSKISTTSTGEFHMLNSLRKEIHKKGSLCLFYIWIHFISMLLC